MYRSTIKFVLFISIALTSVQLGYSQTVRTAPGQITEFDVNGMKVLIKRRLGTPTVAAGLYFRGGVKNLTADNAGIEGFALNIAAEGTRSYPRQKLRKETSSVGTVISAGANYDFSTLAMACTKQSFENSWKIFVDVAINPAFAPEDVERVRGTFLTGLRAQTDSPEGALDFVNDSILYAGHPYTNSPQGTVANITRFKASDLAAYHRGLVQASRMLLVIVGDLEPTDLQKQIEASFGKLPRGDYKDNPLPPLNFSKPTVDITAKAVETNYVKGTFAAPSIRDADYYAMRTAMTVLQQRVFEEVRGKRNLSYAPDAELDDMAANTASISASTTRPNEAVAVMLDEINKIKQGSVDAETIGQMGAYFLTTYYLKEETNAAQAAELAQYELLGGGWRNSLEFLDRMRKVKPAEIQAAANKYMKNIRFVIVG
ncbi:MAG TPA: pitrilysin family protein, partial [Pyrinomonadaceae bacterium]|nr:pitrilysin family protein [Pyrinomonadaceae bacterium]